MTGHPTEKNIGHKVLAALMLLALVLYMGAPLAYADDGDATTTPDQSQATTTPDTSDDGSSISTGDSTSLTNSNNDVNSDLTDADASTTDATSTVTDDNTADVTATTTADADTGSNTATGDGNALIVSGNSVAAANVLNVINTNITNSSGLIELINALNGDGFNLDTPDINSVFGGNNTSNCSLTSCSGLSVSNTNIATVTNTVIVNSSTGNNTASSTGDAGVSTGDAYAAANVLNVVNTNLTNSNYLLLSLNNFGDLNGDITLPGADFFTSMLDNALANSSNVTNNNSAEVTNTVSTDAETGGNNASGGSGSITTGDSYAAASSANLVNTNLTGGGSAYLLINVFGNWTGQIQGLPAGMSWVQTPTGIALMSQSGSFSGLDSDASTTNDNSATVNNNVSVYALTGDNEATSDAGDAGIATGDAYAAANVLNVVNTNVVGQNWLLGILNVFGNWNGNLNFGEPDLWVGAIAQGADPAESGDQITYQFTVANHGDADATNVVLSTDFDPDYLSFGGGATSWPIGDIPAGQSETVSYTATAGNPPGGQQIAVPLTVTASSDETDANPSDNTDQVTILLGQQTQVNGVGIEYTPDAILGLTASSSTSTVMVPGSVDYSVNVTNSGGPAYDAVLYDTLTNAAGDVVDQETWPLDEIDNGDDVNVSYTLNYGTTTASGTYTNSFQVKAIDRNPSTDPFYGWFASSSIVTSPLVIENESGGGQVLGAEIEAPQCAPYLTSYLAPGGDNDPVQVRRLQFFLRDFADIPLTITQIYDAATLAAVKEFQAEHSSQILAPWGLSDPTGVVYFATENLINNMYCQGIASFSLTPSEQSEMLAYRAALSTPALAGSAAPKTPIVDEPRLKPTISLEPTHSSNVASWFGSWLRQVFTFDAPFAQAQGR